MHARTRARVRACALWSFYRISAGVRRCWELEGPNGLGLIVNSEGDAVRLVLRLIDVLDP